MARIVWSQGALHDLALIHSYIDQFDPAAAARIVNALVNAGNSLEDYPHRGRPALRGRRELPSVPPYVLRYSVSGDVVTIETIKHGAQRPD